MSRVGFIGTGAIAAPMVRFLARRGHKITVSERSAALAADLAAEFENVTVTPNQSVVEAAEILFLCLRPHQWQDAVAGLRFRAGQQIVSVMAGVALDDLRAACAPAHRISVTIPLAFLETGGCPLPVYPADTPLTDLLGPENPVIPVPSEAALTTHFAASALLSAALGQMMAGAEWLGRRTGDPAGAETYVTALIAGFLRDVPQDGQGRLLEARSGLATEGTLNLMMVEGLEQAGMAPALASVLDRIAARMEDGARAGSRPPTA